LYRTSWQHRRKSKSAGRAFYVIIGVLLLLLLYVSLAARSIAVVASLAYCVKLELAI